LSDSSATSAGELKKPLLASASGDFWACHGIAYNAMLSVPAILAVLTAIGLFEALQGLQVAVQVSGCTMKTGANS